MAEGRVFNSMRNTYKNVEFLEVYYLQLGRTTGISVHETRKGGRTPGRQGAHVPLRIIQCFQFCGRTCCMCCSLPARLLSKTFLMVHSGTAVATSKGRRASRARSAKRLSRRAFCVLWKAFDSDVLFISSNEGKNGEPNSIDILIGVKPFVGSALVPPENMSFSRARGVRRPTAGL